jgi:hypothetical protein
MTIMSDDLTHISSLVNQSKWFTPLNYAPERDAFLSGEKKNPHFIYPDLPTQDLESFEKELKSSSGVAVDNVEQILFERKKRELLLKIQLFLSLGNEDFTHTSMELYQLQFLPEFIEKAKTDIALNAHFAAQENMTAEDAKHAFITALNEHGLSDWSVEVVDTPDFKIRVKPDQKRMLINREIQWEFSDMDGTLAHELEGHVLRAVNAQKQKNPLFQKLLPFYIKTEEGVASFLADYCSTSNELNRKYHALKYIAGQESLSTDFRHIFELFLAHDFSPNVAFQRTFRLKRGLKDMEEPGLFAKEAMYYQGMLEVKGFIDEGGDIRKLYAGKVGLEDLEYVPIPENQVIPQRLLKYISITKTQS